MKTRDRWPRVEDIREVFQVETEVVLAWGREGLLDIVQLPDGDLRIDPASLRDFVKYTRKTALETLERPR